MIFLIGVIILIKKNQGNQKNHPKITVQTKMLYLCPDKLDNQDMETLNIQIINPKAKSLLLNMAEMNLIQIKPKFTLSEMLTRLRRNESEAPSLEEITQEVEIVRKARYDRKVQNNY